MAFLSRGLRILAIGAITAFALAGCGGGDEAGTVTDADTLTTQTETSGDGEPESAGSVTIEADATTVTIERLDEATSFLNLQSELAGRAAIRTGTCASPGDVVADLGEFSSLLATEVKVEFAELTGGGHVLTIDDSLCVNLQPS